MQLNVTVVLLVLMLVLGVTHAAEDETYGVDGKSQIDAVLLVCLCPYNSLALFLIARYVVSFPMHHNFVSDNYAWLPHNLDPSLPVPDEYKDKPIQHLGDRQSFYNEFLDGCVKFYGEKGGRRCISTERDRIEMSLRQPQSMQVCGSTPFAI